MKFIVLIMTLIGFVANAEEFALDSSHTSIEFKISHLVIATVTGKFKTFEGTFDINEKSKIVKDVSVSIDVASIDTNEAERDKHLKSPDFFEVEKFPKMKFEVKEFKLNKDKQKVTGSLTIRDITKPVSLDLDYKGIVTDPWGNTKLVFSANGKINRKEFGLKWNKNLDKGGVMIGDEVKIFIEAEASKKEKTEKTES